MAEKNEVIVADPQSLIELALQNNVGAKQLKDLMDLQERWQAQVAKKAFLEAMTQFQAGCPVLKKTKDVDFPTKAGRTKYSYTPLGDIIKGIKATLKKHGLSYSWEMEENNNKISVTCTISHIEGHSINTTMSAGLDATGSKNTIQQQGSTVSYLRRYSLTGLLGITSADDDIDGQQSPVKPKNDKPELTPDSDKWGLAVDALVKKSTTITAIKKKYKLTKENEQLLCKNTQNLSK